MASYRPAAASSPQATAGVRPTVSRRGVANHGYSSREGLGFRPNGEPCRLAPARHSAAHFAGVTCSIATDNLSAGKEEMWSAQYFLTRSDLPWYIPYVGISYLCILHGSDIVSLGPWVPKGAQVCGCSWAKILNDKRPLCDSIFALSRGNPCANQIRG